MVAGKFALKLRKHNSAISFEIRLAPFFVKHGDTLIAETSRGEELAWVVKLPVNCEKHGLHEEIRVLHILRKATDDDLKNLDTLAEEEHNLLKQANEILARNAPDVKLISVELLFNRKKAFFYYRNLLEENTDKNKKKTKNTVRKSNSREVQRLLHQELPLAVEVREMGGRSCAYAIGGLGHCGCGLCCTHWQRKPAQVSIKMVKEQNLAINIPKLSGVCGKLMCCLEYELEKSAAVK
jgi:cell fate regulator YaaT (PSP1 superfamily)